MTKDKEAPQEAPTSPKQEAFIREYLIDLNATQAAIRAGYSPKTANEQASRLLANVNIQKRIDILKQERAARVEVNADDVLRELVKLAKSDIRKVWNEDGSLKNMSEWPEEIAGCVASVDVEELFEFEGTGKNKKKVHIGYTKKVRFWDKTKCLDMLGRHLKMFGGEENKGGAIIVVKNADLLEGL